MSHVRKTLGAAMAAAVVVAGCAGVPTSSAPQAIGTVERAAPPSLPTPTPGMEPDVLLREFLKATADPANRHLAARQFLTESASRGWDDAGSALLIDRVVFTETRRPERVSVSMQADILGSLSERRGVRDGRGCAARPGPDRAGEDAGRLADRPAAQRGLPGLAAVSADLQAQHRCTSSIPPASTVVPDPRYVAVSDPDQLATELVTKLIAGPRPEMARTVRNLLAAPLRLRGPVTRADGGKTGVGRGYGGARIELENLSTTDPHTRQLLAAQIIWTLSRAGINGPYVINADGAPLDDRFADGWNTADVAATDPGCRRRCGGRTARAGGWIAGVPGRSAVRPGWPGRSGRCPTRCRRRCRATGQEVASVVMLRAGRAGHGVLAVDRADRRRRGAGASTAAP